MAMAWLIGCSALAFAALYDTKRRPYEALRYFAWLGVISLWVFGGVAIMAP